MSIILGWGILGLFIIVGLGILIKGAGWEIVLSSIGIATLTIGLLFLCAALITGKITF